MRLVSFCWLTGLYVCGCAGIDEGTLRANTPPRAELRAPLIAPLGTGGSCSTDADCLPPRGCDNASGGVCAVRLDASQSLDPDADPLSYQFQFNDGSESASSASAVAYHDFASEGVYEVVVRVTDLHGAEGLAAQDVSVRADYPDPPDFCSPRQPCVAGYTCLQGVCYSDGGTIP